MLLTLTAFTSVVLSIAENTQAAAQGERVYHTLAAHTCSVRSKTASPPLLGYKKLSTAWPSPSTGHPTPCHDMLGFTFGGKSWMRGKSRMLFLSCSHVPCLECWQCLSTPALFFKARTLQLYLHPQSCTPKPGTCWISVAGSWAFPKPPAHRSAAPPTRGISLSVSGMISWAISVCTQEQWASLCACGATCSSKGLQVPPTAPHCTQHTLNPTCGILRPGCSQNSLVYQHEKWCHFDK